MRFQRRRDQRVAQIKTANLRSAIGMYQALSGGAETVRDVREQSCRASRFKNTYRLCNPR